MAAALLAGEPVSYTWEKLGIDLTTPAAFAVDDVLDFCVIVGLEIELDGEEVAVGQRAAFLRGRVTELESTHALIKAVEPDANFILFTGDIENGRVFYRDQSASGAVKLTAAASTIVQVGTFECCAEQGHTRRIASETET